MSRIPRSKAVVVGLVIAGGAWMSCAPGPPPAEAPKAREHTVTRPLHEENVRITVGADGVRVQVVSTAGWSSDSEAKLRFTNGDEVVGRPDYHGVVVIRPDAEALFRSADAPIASVFIEEISTEVDLGPLIAATKKTKPAEWKRMLEARETRRSKADSSVHFAGKIYGDQRGKVVDVCTPSGGERCLDGIDNDCSGRYDDDACGYSSGVVQWTLTWAGPADLDLHAVGPDDIEVSRENPRNPSSKLILDRDCQGTVNGVADCPDGNVENIYAPAEEAPVSGTYLAWIEVNRANAGESSEPIRCRLAGRIGKKTWYSDVKLAPFEGATYRVAFPLGGDTDRDSVVDAHDACPEQQGCWFDDLKHRGCPDTDVDGIPDTIDACPEKTGLSQDDPKRHGCPLEFGSAWVTSRGIKITKRIEFAFGKAELRPESKEVIENVAKAIEAQPGTLKKLSVDGHTDSVGDEADNVHLSHMRARSVFLELVNRGVADDLLTARGFGETEPMTENTTAAGRQTNRRVEFVILDPKPKHFDCWSETP